MTSSQGHYEKAVAILALVEKAEEDAEARNDLVDLDILASWNHNIQRKLKIAEIHMLGALFKKVES